MENQFSSSSAFNLRAIDHFEGDQRRLSAHGLGTPFAVLLALKDAVAFELNFLELIVGFVRVSLNRALADRAFCWPRDHLESPLIIDC
jgi:hypothetical protein